MCDLKLVMSWLLHGRTVASKT